jgi:hypothetical protein
MSELIRRARSRDRSWPGMPPLGTELVDERGVVLLSAWIRGLRAMTTDGAPMTPANRRP